MTEATSSTGDVADTRKYDAWGNYWGGTVPGAADFKLGYTGHQFDVETGLTYARARYYDSNLGRFISRDPFELPPEGAPHLHRYVYGANNPTLHTDPSGEFIPLILAGIALGAELGFFGNIIHQELTQGRDLLTVDYGQAGRAAVVGGVAGGVGAYVAIGAGTVAVAGAQYAGAGAVTTAFAGGAAAGVAGGTAADLTEQGIGLATGTQSSVDWKRTRNAALLGGALGGAGGAAGGYLSKLGDDIADAFATGFQQGVAEVVGGGTVAARSISAVRAVATGNAANAGRSVSEVVETPVGGTLAVPKPPQVALVARGDPPTPIGTEAHISAQNKADPWALLRSHSIGGKRSSRRVVEMASDMKTNDYSGPAVDVVVISERMFVIDGHHRLAAAKMAGLREVPTNVIEDIASHPSSWRTLDEIAQDAASVGPTPCGSWGSSCHTENENMKESDWINILISKYLKCVLLLSQRLTAEFGQSDLLEGRRNGAIPDSGQTASGLEFEFHGIGCWIFDGLRSVDFDFFPGGEVDGFDAWRLHVFSKENQTAVGTRRLQDVQLALDELLRRGLIRPVKGSRLYRRPQLTNRLV